MRLLPIVVFSCILALSLASDWVSDPLKRATAESKRPADLKQYTVNLDLPESERWAEIGALYADKSWMLVQYLRSNLPNGWLKPLEAVAAQLQPFFKDYGEEMQGYAKALGVTEGDIVMVNLVYQLEHLGLSCGTANNTGPVDPRICPPGGRHPSGYGNLQIPDEDDMSERNGPDMCTSFVASTPEGDIYHGRNLDWNLPDSLKQFIINVDYTRGGETVFTGTTIVGFVGILHAVKANGFAWSMDARRKGGSIPFNALEGFLLDGVRTPEQHARAVFEDASVTTYSQAVKALSEHKLVNPAYYIVSGTKVPEGTVLARGREGLEKHWDMDGEIQGQEKWYVGVTNYDLDHNPPPSDDRSTPLAQNMNALAGKEFGETEVWDVLKTWPTFNQHTDVSMVAKPKDGFFNTLKWYDH